MRISTVVAAVAASAVVTLPLAGVALAGGSRSCSEYTNKADAQTDLDAGGNKALLDPDGDGVACSAKKKDDDSDNDKSDKKHDDSDDNDSDDDDDDDKDDKSKDKDDQVKVKPKGSVDTGDGSTQGGPAPLLVTLAGGTVLGVSTLALRRAGSSR
jgi:hypothetical protein